MAQENIISSTEVSFKDFLFKNKRNRTILWLAAAAVLIQFAIFKYFYPFASYIHGDSFSYIRAADQNLFINTYLIGYSKFLRLFSIFAKSDLALVGFQYVFIQLTALYLLFTLFYFYKPGKITQIILLAFMVLNPLSLYLANLISSDGLFLGLSFLWLSTLLWIVQGYSRRLILWHTVILFIAFTVRYNALIYPIISIGVLLLPRIPMKVKMKSITTCLLPIVLFVIATSYQYKKLTGYWQYSPFSGWQMANNAMYTYRFVSKEERKEVPPKFYELDKMIREYFDSTRDVNKYPIEKLLASTVYMWTPTMPLYKYRNKLFAKDTSATEFKLWASIGPMYKDYGLYIIKNYPGYFLQYFIWPNANKYYAPPVEFLETYNSGRNYVKEEAKLWFGYKSEKVFTRTPSEKNMILDFYPILAGIANILFAFLVLFFIVLKGWRYDIKFKNATFIVSIFWLCNACFTIYASSAAIRFQSFPILLAVIFDSVLLDWMIKQLSMMSNVKKLTELKDELILASS